MRRNNNLECGFEQDISNLNQLVFRSAEELFGILETKTSKSFSEKKEHIKEHIIKLFELYYDYLIKKDVINNKELIKYVVKLRRMYGITEKVFYRVGVMIISGKLTKEEILDFVILEIFGRSTIESEKKYLAYNLCLLSQLSFEESLEYYKLFFKGSGNLDDKEFLIYGILDLAKRSILTINECYEYVYLYKKPDKQPEEYRKNEQLLIKHVCGDTISHHKKIMKLLRLEYRDKGRTINRRR